MQLTRCVKVGYARLPMLMFSNSVAALRFALNRIARYCGIISYAIVT